MARRRARDGRDRPRRARAAIGASRRGGAAGGRDRARTNAGELLHDDVAERGRDRDTTGPSAGPATGSGFIAAVPAARAPQMRPRDHAHTRVHDITLRQALRPDRSTVHESVHHPSQATSDDPEPMVEARESLLDELVAEHLARFGRATRDAYRRDIALYRDFLAGSRSDLLGARTSDLSGWIENLERSGHARASIARRISAVAGLYDALVAAGHLERSPAGGVHRPGPDAPVRLGLDADILARLGAKARDAGPGQELLVALLLYRGLRVSEAVGIDVRDVVRHEGQLHLDVRRKGGRREAVGVPAGVVPLVDAAVARAVSGPLFTGRRGGRLTRQVAWRLVRELGVAAGIDQAIFPHLLRHSYVSQALLAGVDIAVVSAGAGHVDIRTTRVYARALDALGARAGDAVFERVTSSQC